MSLAQHGLQSRHTQEAGRSLHWDKNHIISVTHLRYQALVRYLFRSYLGRGQQGAAKRWDVIGPRVARIRVYARAVLFRACEHISRMLCEMAFVVEFLDGVLQFLAEFSRHDQLRELLASFHVLDAVPAYVALRRFVRAPDRTEPIVRIAFCVLRLLGRRLVAPDLFLNIRETIPAVRNDARDVAVVVLDIGVNLLGGGKGGAEEHERVPWTRDVIGVFVTRRGARGGDGHGCEERRGWEGVEEGV